MTDAAPQKPVWLPGEPFPHALAVWNWATALNQYARRGEHETYLKILKRYHEEAVVEEVKTLARARWRAG